MKFKEPFCTMVVVRNESPSTRSCGHKPGRTNILFDEFVVTSRNARIKKEILSLIPPVIIGLASWIGYEYWGNAPGFPAAVAFGVAISQYFNTRYISH